MTYQEIDLNNYPRQGMFYAFKDREIPFFSVTVNIEITTFLSFTKQIKSGFFIPLSYLITKTVNEIPQFKHRIIGDKLVEFTQIEPSFTVLLENETFSFCDSKYFPTYCDYAEYTREQIERVKINPDSSTGEKNNRFFLTNIPWYSFTSITHPFSQEYATVPVIALGKYFQQNNSIMLPIGVQIHHAIADGIHVAKFFQKLENMCHNSEDYLL
jgi:chloramphenicol O-acetyltransferase type A